MRITLHESEPLLRSRTKSLLAKTLSPLCGLSQAVGFATRGRGEPRFVVAGGELTGVHVLAGHPQPKAGFYHIGGGGIFVDEALIRTLGESLERYAQFVSMVSGQHPIQVETYQSLISSGKRILPVENQFKFFSDAQFSRNGFPFEKFSPSKPIGWTQARTLPSLEPVWVPAQLVLTGYQPNTAQGEPWLLPAVTTGSAAHVTLDFAMRNALLELVQVDAAMGHWYSAQVARRIAFDSRTEVLERIIERHFPNSGPKPSFYFLPSADLPGINIACVLRDEEGRFPARVIGLGSDIKLTHAMYKALLEAVGVLQLVKVSTINALYSGELANLQRNVDRFLDLDSNVIYYANPERVSSVDRKFSDTRPILASQLPPDIEGSASDHCRLLIKAFIATGKDLIYLDLTTTDIRMLGFRVVRLWSPHTLSLCLPSYPPALHSRFLAYGGVANDAPHPYP